MFKKLIALATLTVTLNACASVNVEEMPDIRFDQLTAASDIMWCDLDMCTLYRSKEIIWREEYMPLGYMILINDESFEQEEIERYKDKLMSHWAHVME